MRVKKKELLELVEDTRRITGLPIEIEWAYGRPRLYLRSEELSPRLSIPELYDWIYAWRDGFTKGYSFAFHQQ